MEKVSLNTVLEQNQGLLVIDILSAAYVALTIFFIIARHKVIFELFDDFWKRYLPAKERGENPPYVTYDCKGND